MDRFGGDSYEGPGRVKVKLLPAKGGAAGARALHRSAMDELASLDQSTRENALERF
jgi:hypothetical protein